MNLLRWCTLIRAPLPPDPRRPAVTHFVDFAETQVTIAAPGGEPMVRLDIRTPYMAAPEPIAYVPVRELREWLDRECPR